MDQRQILLFHLLFLFLQLLLKLRKPSILKLRRLFQIIALLRCLDLLIHFFNLFPKPAQSLYGVLLVIPLGLFIVKFITKFCQLPLQRL